MFLGEWSNGSTGNSTLKSLILSYGLRFIPFMWKQLPFTFSCRIVQRTTKSVLGLTKQICRLSSPFFQYFKRAGGYYSLFIGQFLSLKRATPLNKRVWRPACEGQRLTCGNRFVEIATNLGWFCQFLLAKLNTLEKERFLVLAML